MSRGNMDGRRERTGETAQEWREGDPIARHRLSCEVRIGAPKRASTKITKVVPCSSVSKSTMCFKIDHGASSGVRSAVRFAWPLD